MRLIDADRLSGILAMDCDLLVEQAKKQYPHLYVAVINLIEARHKETQRRIQEAPTVDAEPVRPGKWWRIPLEQVGHPENKFFMYRCSECKATSYEKHNYCPKCGAKMDGRKHETD